MSHLSTNILPVSFFPKTATRLHLRAVGFDRSPIYLATFQHVTPATATEPEKIETLAARNESMTVEQWNEWPAGDLPELDDAYQVSCLAANLGVTPTA